MTNPINLYRYGFLFAAAYAAIILITNIIVHFLNLEIGNSLNAGILIGSVAFTATQFVNDQQRKPERKEKLIITGLCFLATIVISLVAMTILSVVNDVNLMEMFAGISLPILLASIAVSILLYLAIIYFTFGLFAAIIYKKKNK